MAPATVLISGLGIAGPALAYWLARYGHRSRTHLMTPAAVRPDGRRTYDVALRPMREMRGGREVEIVRDDLVRNLYNAVVDDVDVRPAATCAPRRCCGSGWAPRWRSSTPICSPTTSAPQPSDAALAVWERNFRPNDEQNHRLPTDGMATLLPGP